MSLPDFEGLPVTAVAITIPNAAGGFRDPLEIEPVVLHQGDEVYATFKLCDECQHERELVEAGE